MSAKVLLWVVFSEQWVCEQSPHHRSGMLSKETFQDWQPSTLPWWVIISSGYNLEGAPILPRMSHFIFWVPLSERGLFGVSVCVLWIIVLACCHVAIISLTGISNLQFVEYCQSTEQFWITPAFHWLLSFGYSCKLKSVLAYRLLEVTSGCRCDKWYWLLLHVNKRVGSGKFKAYFPSIWLISDAQ